MNNEPVTVNAPVSYNRWQVPNFASPVRPPRPRQEGIDGDRGVPVVELPAEALDALARAWLEDLYRKAGRDVPTFTP